MTMRSSASITTACAAALILAPIANADDVIDYEFGDSSKHIACSLKYWPVGTRGSDKVLNTVQCSIDAHTWVGPQDSGGTLPCSASGYSFMLRETGVPEVHCFTQGQVNPTIYSVLEYGQSKTAGSITCTSAPDPTGITCTNASSGDSFRVSADSFEVG